MCGPRCDEKVYDVCIVGAGPQGLSMLSALHTPAEWRWMNDAQREKSSSPKSGWSRDPAVKPGTERRKEWSVCVVDDQAWLEQWSARFEALDIKWLRSPAMAHPSASSEDALIEFARRTGRTDELLELDLELHDANGQPRNSQMKGLWKTYSGLYALPTQRLFRDFCSELAESLPHDFIKSRVHKIVRHPAEDEDCESNDEGGDERVEECDEVMELVLKNGTRVWARYIVLAIGAAGEPSVPSKHKTSDDQQCGSPAKSVKQTGIPCIEHTALWATATEMLHSSEWYRFNDIAREDSVLVIGGGLSAVQAALAAVKRGAMVTLSSRRPLQTRHFDLPLKWFDPRHATEQRFPFYQMSNRDRLKWMSNVKGGGTVSPMYMAALRQAVELGQITLFDDMDLRLLAASPLVGADASGSTFGNSGGSAQIVSESQAVSSAAARTSNLGRSSAASDPIDSREVAGSSNSSIDIYVASTEASTKAGAKSPQGTARTIEHVSTTKKFDKVILGTGFKPDCRALPLIRDLLDNTAKVPIVGGFPVLSMDLQWGSLPVFVVGELAALQLGPGAQNLMGARRGADMVASQLASFRLGTSTRKEEPQGAYTNIYELLAEESDYTSSEESSEDCAT